MTEELENKGCSVINAAGDAVVDIVKAAAHESEKQSTTVIGEDTDLLVLLLFYADPDRRDLYFRSDKSKDIKVYHINLIKKVLGCDLCSHKLFAHSFSGCDSSSHIFGLGKKSVFQRLVKGDSIIQTAANSFLLPNHVKHKISDLGRQVMTVIFGGNVTDSLASLRYKSLGKKVITAKSFFNPEQLLGTYWLSSSFHLQSTEFISFVILVHTIIW